MMLDSPKAVVVAHPDDESLWMGGLIASSPGWDVICCTVPRRDPIRAWKFYAACRALGANGCVFPMTEPAVNDVDLGAFAFIDLSPYRTIATHGSAGEYGHPHHLAVTRFVLSQAQGTVLLHGDEGISLGLDDSAYSAKCAAVGAYDHVLHYPPLGDVTKAEALKHRYGIARTETYGIA